MKSETYQPKRTRKLQIRITFYCLLVAIPLSIPFATTIMGWQLGFYPTIGDPLFVLPKALTFGIRMLAIIFFITGIIQLYRKKYNFAGGLFCVAGILLWGLFQPIYNPWFLFRWIYSYWSVPQAQPAINSAFYSLSGFILLFTTSEVLLFKKKRKEASGAYGTAEMASGDELLKNNGLIVGRHRKSNKFLRYNENRHLITIAPTRSGKGVSSIIPNILTYRNSLIVVDPKGENCDHTYKQRQEMGQEVYVLDPFQISNYSRYHGSNSFNPLDSVEYQDEAALEYCNDIRDSIITRNPHGLKDFWMRAAQDMYSGFLYYISQAPEYNDNNHHPYKPELRKLTTVNDLLKLKQDDLMQYTRNISQSDKIPLQVKKVANDILSDSNSKKMLGSIIKTLQVNIEFMDSPFLRSTLRHSDFNLEEIINGNATLYIILPPDKIRIYNKWLKMIVELIIKKTTQVRNPKDPNISDKKILFILDEFANLGRMEYVKDSYSIIAGYGMQMWSFVQNVSQLKNTYKDDWQTFISNSGIFQSFGANEIETAEYISNMLGETTTFSEMSSQQTEISDIGIADDAGSSRRVSERQRALKTPDEVMRIPQDEQIIKKDGINPIQSKKVKYYSDPEFKGKFTSREEANDLANDAPPITKPRADTVAEKHLREIIDMDSAPKKEFKNKEENKRTSNSKKKEEPKSTRAIFGASQDNEIDV